jgi:hypothetical protein
LDVRRSTLGVRCLSPPFLPITDLILSAFLPLQHSNTPTLQPSPLPAPRSFATPTRFCPPSTFDVPCSVFGVRCLSLSSLPFTDHGSPITFVSFAPSSLPRRVRQTFYAAPHSPPAFDVRRSVFGVRCSALGVGRSTFISPLSGVTAPPIHCFARDLLLYCFMTKSRCWPAHSRHAELPNL